jgi:hypothetical protein
MLQDIAHIQQQADTEISSITTADQLEAFRVRFLARKGTIAALFDALKTVTPQEKPSTNSGAMFRAFWTRKRPPCKRGLRPPHPWT